MSGSLIAAVLALGLGVVVVRRRSMALALVALQSLLLGIGALQVGAGGSAAFASATVVLLVKAAVLPALLLIVMRRNREPRLVTPAASSLARLAGAGAVALAVLVLVPPLGLADRQAEQTAFALVLVGIVIVAARRPAFMQVLGLIVAENGLSLLAVAAPGGLPHVIELGALFDLAVVVAVGAGFTERIHGELGTGDTELLRSLRD